MLFLHLTPHNFMPLCVTMFHLSFHQFLIWGKNSVILFKAQSRWHVFHESFPNLLSSVVLWEKECLLLGLHDYNFPHCISSSPLWEFLGSELCFTYSAYITSSSHRSPQSSFVSVVVKLVEFTNGRLLSWEDTHTYTHTHPNRKPHTHTHTHTPQQKTKDRQESSRSEACRERRAWSNPLGPPAGRRKGVQAALKLTVKPGALCPLEWGLG